MRDLTYIEAKLPGILENCLACFEVTKEWHRVKQLRTHQELLFPRLYQSLRTAMRPAMAVRSTGLENKLFGRGAALTQQQSNGTNNLPDDELD